jgi:uncharacterized protein (DUF1697 family)
MIIALLRGINVGGSHRLPMAVLRDGLAARGCTDVTTYIQSGNLLLTPPTDVGDPDTWLTAEISGIAGFEVPTVTRTTTELADVVTANPYPTAAGTTLHVTFFATPPPDAAFTGAEIAALAPESCVLRGRELYMHLPNGAGRAKLPMAVDRAQRGSGSVGTTRNWNTVTTLLELTHRARS